MTPPTTDDYMILWTSGILTAFFVLSALMVGGDLSRNCALMAVLTGSFFGMCVGTIARPH